MLLFKYQYGLIQKTFSTPHAVSDIISTICAVTSVQILQSSSATRLVTPLECGTFQNIQSASLFNSLPTNLRIYSDFRIFCWERM